MKYLSTRFGRAGREIFGSSTWRWDRPHAKYFVPSGLPTQSIIKYYFCFLQWKHLMWAKLTEFCSNPNANWRKNPIYLLEKKCVTFTNTAKRYIRNWLYPTRLWTQVGSMMAHLFLCLLSWISKFLLILKQIMFKLKKKIQVPQWLRDA